jgi:hypothetical protein
LGADDGSKATPIYTSRAPIARAAPRQALALSEVRWKKPTGIA